MQLNINRSSSSSDTNSTGVVTSSNTLYCDWIYPYPGPYTYPNYYYPPTYTVSTFPEYKPWDIVKRSDIVKRLSGNCNVYDLYIDCPGYCEKDLNIEIDKNIVKITGYRNLGNKALNFKNRPESINLAIDISEYNFKINENDIYASYTDGVIQITFRTEYKVHIKLS